MPDHDVVAALAISLDGYLAESDGSVGFLEKYPMTDFDFDGFVAGIGGLIMGSTTYEQAVAWGWGWDWGWGHLPTMVLTTRTGLPIPDGADVTFSSLPTPKAIRSYSAATPNRLWVFGGGNVITAGLQGGAIDTLDLTVMPEALGNGIPLFTGPVPGPIELVQTTPYDNGAVRLVYRVGGRPPDTPS